MTDPDDLQARAPIPAYGAAPPAAQCGGVSRVRRDPRPLGGRSDSPPHPSHYGADIGVPVESQCGHHGGCPRVVRPHGTVRGDRAARDGRARGVFTDRPAAFLALHRCATDHARTLVRAPQTRVHRPITYLVTRSCVGAGARVTGPATHCFTRSAAFSDHHPVRTARRVGSPRSARVHPLARQRRRRRQRRRPILRQPPHSS